MTRPPRGGLRDRLPRHADARPVRPLVTLESFALVSVAAFVSVIIRPIWSDFLADGRCGQLLPPLLVLTSGTANRHSHGPSLLTSRREDHSPSGTALVGDTDADEGRAIAWTPHDCGVAWASSKRRAVDDLSYAGEALLTSIIRPD